MKKYLNNFLLIVAALLCVCVAFCLMGAVVLGVFYILITVMGIPYTPYIVFGILLVSIAYSLASCTRWWKE